MSDKRYALAAACLAPLLMLTLVLASARAMAAPPSPTLQASNLQPPASSLQSPTSTTFHSSLVTRQCAFTAITN